MAVKFNPFTGNLDLIDTTAAAGSTTQIQYNNAGLLAGSADLTWDDSGKELGVGGDINLDDGGTYTTTVQTVTPTANRTISFPDATGTLGLVAGSSGQVVYNNAGAYAGVSTMTFDGTSVTLAGRLINSYSGTASSPAKVFTGAWFTGGTSTTTKPQLLIEPSGATSTGWSTSGTGLGINAASGFTGRLLDLQLNGTSQMVVQGDGKLLVGTSSALSNVRVGGAGGIAPQVQIQGTTADTAAFSATRTTGGPPYFAVNRGSSGNNVAAGDPLGVYSFNGFDGTNYTTAAQISAVVDGTPGADDMPGRLVFATTADGASSPTERMRIGNNGRLDLFATAPTYGFYLGHSDAAGTTKYFIVAGHSASAINTGTVSFTVSTNGNVLNTNGSYGQISDIKLKENVVDAESQWDDFKAVRFRKYNFKEETGYETHTQLGVIAQELELVSPGLVYETPDLDEEGNDLGTTTKVVKSSVLVKKALVALQEAMERIEQLEAKVAALEAS